MVIDLLIPTISFFLIAGGGWNKPTSFPHFLISMVALFHSMGCGFRIIKFIAEDMEAEG